MNTHVPQEIFLLTLNNACINMKIKVDDPVFFKLREILVDKKCEEENQLRMDKLYLLVDLCQILPRNKVPVTKL